MWSVGKRKAGYLSHSVSIVIFLPL